MNRVMFGYLKLIFEYFGLYKKFLICLPLLFPGSVDSMPLSHDPPLASAAAMEEEEEENPPQDEDEDVPMATVDEEEVEEEQYRCETCNSTFQSLTEFMDHRNFDCLTGRF